MGNSPLTSEGPRIVTYPPEREGESQVFRSSLSGEFLVETLDENIRTLYDCFKNSVDKNPNKKCLGYREGESPYKWISYKLAYTRARNIGCGFIELGCKPHQDKIGIYSVNRVEWVLVEQACNAYALTLVPLYDTLGHDACSFIINESELSIVVCTPDKTALLLGMGCQSLKFVIQMGELTMENKELAESKGIKLISFTGLEALGQNNPVEVVPPDPEDISTICYTSGTTGNPKGVILTHRNFVAELSGVTLHGIVIEPTDVHISYLPLAHAFERMIMIAITTAGGCAGFFRGNILNLFDDIQVLKPTLFPSVPRLFNKLHDKVIQTVKEGGGFKESLFFKAYDTKVKALEEGYINDTLWDTVVFGKVAEKLGGRVRLMITGSAPISKDVLKFLRVAFSCPVYEGYGQTETCAGATITLNSDLIPGHVGVPLPCVEVKLVDVPDMNYFTKDDPNPRGEVCFRGPCCTSGYYKNEEKTKELIDEYGWLHSGDVGEILPDGSLKIIDRKKNIFKLSIGEYIAPEKLEIVFGKSRFVAQIFVYGDSLKSKLIAIVVPEPEYLKSWAQENGINDTDLETLCKNQQVIEAILQDMNKTGQENDIRGFERIHAIHLSPNQFTIENDLLTPTFKLKRPQAKTAYTNEINELYEMVGE